MGSGQLIFDTIRVLFLYSIVLLQYYFCMKRSANKHETRLSIKSILWNSVNVTNGQTILFNSHLKDLKIVAFMKVNNWICFIDQWKKNSKVSPKYLKPKSVSFKNCVWWTDRNRKTDLSVLNLMLGCISQLITILKINFFHS